jgi:hypothetical protein
MNSFIKSLIISILIVIGLVVAFAIFGTQIDARIGLPNASNYIAIFFGSIGILATFYPTHEQED